MVPLVFVGVFCVFLGLGLCVLFCLFVFSEYIFIENERKNFVYLIFQAPVIKISLCNLLCHQKDRALQSLETEENIYQVPNC